MSTWRHVGCVTACSLLLGLMVACAPRIPGIGNSASSIGDGGFLSGEPCGPPCFRGIVPGETTETEAIQILQAEGQYQGCEAYLNSGGRGLYCLSGVDIAYQADTDIVSEVGFRLSQTVTVGDAITEHGEPNAVLMAVISRYPSSGIVLYYDDFHMRLQLPQQEGDEFIVEASTEVEYVSYLSTAAYTSHLPAIDSLPEWHGYGEYQEYDPR